MHVISSEYLAGGGFAVRKFVAVLLFLAFFILLIYGGFNMVEHSMAGLLAHTCESAAFYLRIEPPGALLVTFGGKTVRLSAGESLAALKRQFEKLLDRSHRIFTGKILDKTPDG